MIMCNDECWQLTHQGHSQSTSFAALLGVQTHARASELYLRCLHHTTYHLGFPSLTEVEAAMSEGPYLSPSFVLPAAIIWRSVCHPPPPAKPHSRLAQRSVPEPARLSSLPSTPTHPLADLTTKRRFLLKEGKKKTKKYVQGKKERKKRKKKRRPHRQCCQVNNKCASSLYTLHNKNNVKARYGLTERRKT